MFNKGLIKKLAAVVMSAVTLFSVSGLSSAYVSAADTNHFKFADIDLVVDVPKELICFTRTTTNNNSYLEKLGVDEAAVLTNNMIAIYNNFIINIFWNSIKVINLINCQNNRLS